MVVVVLLLLRTTCGAKRGRGGMGASVRAEAGKGRKSGFVSSRGGRRREEEAQQARPVQAAKNNNAQGPAFGFLNYYP